jgi:3-oxoadipate enol-lactonase
LPISSIREFYVDVEGGIRLRYVRRGDTAGPRFLLVHSLAMDSDFWGPVADRLSTIGDIVCVDCRGHGMSDKPATPYSVELFADDLVAVLDDAGWEEAIVAGASMGGCVALSFADRHPDRCVGLGLFDTTSWYGPEAPQQWEERAQKALAEGLSSLVDFQKTRWFSDAFRAADPVTVEGCVETFLRNEVAAYAATCRMLGAVDLRSALGRISLPTRIAVGEQDYATPLAMAETMRDAIHGATLTVLAGGRHFTPLERPDRIAEELRMLSEVAYP